MHNCRMETKSCANCGELRQGEFCWRCGQNNRNYHRSLPPLLGELLRETFEIDSRVFRTLRYLLCKPGELALEFSRNRRASYVSPIRLYLFVSLSFFFLLSLTTDFQDASNRVELGELDVSDAATDTLPAQTEAQIGELSGRLSDERIRKLNAMLSEPEGTLRNGLASTLMEVLVDESEASAGIQQFVIGQLIDAAYAPRDAISALLENLPLAMFLMLPVFAMLLTLMYWRRERYYVEHLVFATHLHTFAFLIYIVLLLLPEVPEVPAAVQGSAATEPATPALLAVADIVSDAMPFLLALYHLLALRRFYGGGWVGTLFAFGFQMTVYFVVLMPISLALVALFTVATL